MLSIIIPSKNEQFLNQTIEDLLKNAHGEIEVIAILDGYKTDLPQDDRVRFVYHEESVGMRRGINSGVEAAKGDYIMKIDAHCMVSPGFDVELVNSCEPNWVMIPRRKRLDAENWCVQDVGKPDVDYEYLTYPDNPNDWGGACITGKLWTERAIARKDIAIDDTPASQGSCWFMHKEYFKELGLMDYENYGPFFNESQEIATKAVLSGGRYVVNKNTWYAHLHKGKKYGRGYRMENNWLNQGREGTMRLMSGKKIFATQKYPFSHMIEMYMPMPSWDEKRLSDLKQIEYDNYNRS